MDCLTPLLSDISKIFVVDTRGIYSIVIGYKKEKVYTDRMPGNASPSKEVASQMHRTMQRRYQSDAVEDTKAAYLNKKENALRSSNDDDKPHNTTLIKNDLLE